MKINIDPKVDCVFKALLGSEENQDLLIHFLNAIIGLQGEERIESVQILNPFNERTHLEDKLSVVDVKARDGAGNLYQIDIQGVLHRYLGERMAYNWSSIFGEQLKAGQTYEKIRPVVSIWVLGDNMFPALAPNIHRLRLSDKETGAIIVEKSAVCILELPKYRLGDPILNESQRWQRFFIEGQDLDPNNLPDYMKTQEMEKAMSTLKSFDDRAERAMLYRDRRLKQIYDDSMAKLKRDAEEKTRDAEEKIREAEEKIKECALLDEQSRERIELSKELDEANQRKAEANKRKAEANQQEAEALKAKERALQAKEEALREKLKALGLDPDSL